MTLGIDFAFNDYNVLRIFLAIGMLSIASFFDVKKREVHDLLWIVFGGIGILLFLLNWENPDFLFQTALSLIIVPIVYIMWRIGLFGGADVLAVSTLVFLAPMSTFSGQQITPFTVLLNAGLLSLMVFILNAIKNTVAEGQSLFSGEGT